MKTKTTSVKVERPVATVTVTIEGKDHIMTEPEARQLYDKLQSALGIQPQVIFRPIDNNPFRDRAIPMPERHPIYYQPSPPSTGEPYRVTCLAGNS